jgi:hypothetical protein
MLHRLYEPGKSGREPIADQSRVFPLFPTVPTTPVIANMRAPHPVITHPSNAFWQPATFKFGEPEMSDSPRVSLLSVFCLLLAVLISPRFAYAQSTGTDSTWTVLDVTAAINRAIEESKDGVELREKVVRRFSECSLMYGGLSTLASNAEAKKNYVQAQAATMEVEWTIGKPLQTEKRLEIEGAARKSVAMMLRAMKVQGEKEVGPLLKNCKALNDLKEIKNALRELALH